MQRNVQEFLDRNLNPRRLTLEEVSLSAETVEAIYHLEARFGLPARLLTELTIEWRLREGPRAPLLKERKMPVETAFLIGVAVGWRERP